MNGINMIDLNTLNKNYIFPKFNLETINIKEELEKCCNKIYKIQTSSNENGLCKLSFYPLAKNVRFISSHFYNSICSDKSPKLSDNCRDGEDNFWYSNTGDSWYPWLWCRYKNDLKNNRESWNHIFKNIDDLIDINLNNTCDDKNINEFILYLACLSHTFRLNDDTLNDLINRFYTSIPDNVCGLQIRRGEIVSKHGDINTNWTDRPIYSIDEYMDSAKIICENIDTKNIFVSTDSIEVIHYLETNYKDYTFYHNMYDRNLFIRYDKNQNQIPLEYYLKDKPNLIKHYTESSLIDLYSLSLCKGYVGEMVYSEYGVTGWFLQMAKQKNITPYYNMAGEFNLSSNSVGMLLI